MILSACVVGETGTNRLIILLITLFSLWKALGNKGGYESVWQGGRVQLMSGVGEGVLEEVIFELSTDEWVELHWVKEGCGQLWRSKWILGRGNSCAKTLGQEVAWCLGGSERGYDTRLGRPMKNIWSCRVLKTMLKNLVFTPKNNELLKHIEGYSLFVDILHSMVREEKKNQV